MTIYFKSGHYYFLSNFYEEPFYMDGKLYSTAEHAYQASKSPSPEGDKWVREAISPAQAKKRGQQIITKDNWDLIKIIAMKKVVKAKFAHSLHMQKLLLDTIPHDLVEYTTWNDTFWGVNTKYEGRNELGKILMEVRKEISL